MGKYILSIPGACSHGRGEDKNKYNSSKGDGNRTDKLNYMPDRIYIFFSAKVL